MILSADQARILRFATVGGAVAVLYVGLYVAFLTAGLPQAWANGAAFALAVCVQYVGQTWWTFRRPLAVPDQARRFACTVGFGFLTSGLITGLAGPALGLSDTLSAAIVAVVLPVQNYVIFRLWVFADPGHKKQSEQ